MKLKLTAVTLSTMALVWVAVPASAATLLGQIDQGNAQGNNSNQSGINGTSGTTQILNDSTPVLTQDSLNVQGNTQAAAGANSTLIANGPGAGFGQLNKGAINSDQTAVNGDSGTGLGQTTATTHQNSTNVIVGSELLAAGADNIVIGSSSQGSQVGVNSEQTANNFPGGGPALGLLEQDSINLVPSTIILGG